MVTAALPGENGVAARWKADPSAAVAAIGEGLRQLHEALPTGGCPFTWGVEERLEDVGLLHTAPHIAARREGGSSKVRVPNRRTTSRSPTVR